RVAHSRCSFAFCLIRRRSPLGLPSTPSLAPLRWRAPFAWLTRVARSLSVSLAGLLAIRDTHLDSLAGQFLVQPLQLVLVHEVDLDASAFAAAVDADARAQRKTEPVFGRSRMDVAFLFGLLRVLAGAPLHQRLGLAHRQIARDDFAAGMELRGFVGQRE